MLQMPGVMSALVLKIGVVGGGIHQRHIFGLVQSCS